MEDETAEERLLQGEIAGLNEQLDKYHTWLAARDAEIERLRGLIGRFLEHARSGAAFIYPLGSLQELEQAATRAEQKE